MLKNISLKEFQVNRLKYKVDEKTSISDTQLIDNTVVFNFTDGTPTMQFDFFGGICKAFKKGSVTIFLNRHSPTVFALYAFQYKKSNKNTGNSGFTMNVDSYPIGLFELDGFIGVFDILVTYEFREIGYSQAYLEYTKIVKSIYGSANDVMQRRIFSI